MGLNIADINVFFIQRLRTLFIFVTFSHFLTFKNIFERIFIYGFRLQLESFVAKQNFSRQIVVVTRT